MPWLSTHLGHGQPAPANHGQRRHSGSAALAGGRRAPRHAGGFDIVYVYAGMGYLPYEFLLPEYNRRTDAYAVRSRIECAWCGSSLSVTRDAVGDKCAVALRISVEELRGRPGRTPPPRRNEVVALLADIPDLWDVKMDSSPTDCAPSAVLARRQPRTIVNFVKQLTKRPVVGVGRFTSPDVMVSQVRRGILDLIGGARPSIADPFLPNKINEGREHEIANASVATSASRAGTTACPCAAPRIRPPAKNGGAIGIRKRFAPPASDSSILIVGGGPAGSNAPRRSPVAAIP